MADEKQEIKPDTPKAIGEAMGEIDSASVMGVNIEIVAVLGVAELQVSQVLQLGRGAVVELERKLDEPIDLIAKGQLVARDEVVVVDDMLAIQITDVIKR